MSTSPSKSITTYSTFSQEYTDKCKIFWYSSGRPDAVKFKRILEDNKFQDEKKKIPSLPLLRTWIINYGWNEWADIMDARASELVETSIVEQKAKMLRQQAEMGERLQLLGMKFLSTDGFDSSSSAVQAVIKGAELERTSRGIGETIMRLMKLTDDELKNEIISQLHRASENGQIIETEEVKSKDEE